MVLEDDRLYGILTDRDIVVRVLAEESDPAVVTVGEVCSRGLTTISPTASLGEAVQLVLEKAIRRLRVVEGEVVGIVSLGDIAVARDSARRPRQVARVRTGIFESFSSSRQRRRMGHHS